MTSIIVQSLDISDFVTDCDQIPFLVRNQDLSLVAEGFSFSIGFSSLNLPSVGNTVLVKHNGIDVYQGIVKSVSSDHNQLVYRIEVENILLRMEDTMVSFEELGSFFSDVVSPDPWQTCSFIRNANSVYAPNHRLYDDEGVIFHTDGSLPGGINPDTVYYVRRLDPDYFQLREHMQAGSAILFTTDGSGDHEYNYADVSEWNYRDNENSPNINLNRTLKHMFVACGLILDSSAVESVTLYSRNVEGTNYTYDIRSLCLDEYMLYCLNIDSAMLYTKIDDPESSADFSYSKISLWDFVSFLCGMFGFILEPSNGYWGKFRLLKRTTPFSVSDDNVTGLIEKQKAKDGGGYTIYMKRNDLRSAYKTPTESELSEYEKSVTGGGKEEITLWNNLKILLRDKRPGAPAGAVLSSASYFVELHKMLSNQLLAYNYDMNRKEWSVRGSFPSGDVLELKIDAVMNQYSIISETYDF
jgi:hypothetical protein